MAKGFGTLLSYNMLAKKEIFNSLLNALWLRPESALWYAHMLSSAKRMAAHKLPQPSLDFGVMDGLNTFVLLGGNVPVSFDVFDEVLTDTKMFKKSTLKHDYYDCVQKKIKWKLLAPKNKFTFGLDWKKSHLIKAKRFHSHKELILWDPKKSIEGIKENTLGGIWAPNIYWMEDLPETLIKLVKITKPGGKIITIVPDKELPRHMVLNGKGEFPEPWLKDLDRGRYQNASRMKKNFQEWNSFFRSQNIKVLHHEKFLPAEINSIYEIGFRPMFGPLVEMRSLIKKLGDEQFLQIKKAWLKQIKVLAKPFFSRAAFYSNHSYLWHMFVISPNK